MRYVSAAEAGELLREGRVGLVPTETVVGLVAGKAGLSRLFDIKGRDSGKPIAVLCGAAEEALTLGRNIPPLARSLADRFWPGPLTLVLEAEGGGTVGVRVPAHPVTWAVLTSHGGPLYATSANPSGGSAPRALEEVDPAISTAVDFAVKGEPGSGESSAVVDLSGGNVRLLRATTSLTEDELARLAKG
ncbi:MAG: Sua5/YciO/YrdC/YwlC family protein [Actinomycetota bacterium]|nr:Sua5/YciO/YrdC/YwlC family protein [Actinomycetota bacterium]